jgi:hypothetical protein
MSFQKTEVWQIGIAHEIGEHLLKYFFGTQKQTYNNENKK